MSDHTSPSADTPAGEPTPFDTLLGQSATAFGSGFTTAFRGYDKDEVDAAVADLAARMRASNDEIAQLKQHQRRAGAAVAQSRAKAERLDAELEALKAGHEEDVKSARAAVEDELQSVRDQIESLRAQHQDELERVRAEVAAARESSGDEVARLEAELAAATARAATAEKRVETLSEELVAAPDSAGRPQFEEILRVAEEQASVLIRNASVQGDRLLEAARAENENRRKEVRAEADAILSEAHHEAQQIRLKIETELMAHQATIEREAAHAAEKVAQAEREAAAIRAEAEKGAAALRSMVARETTRDRSEAEETVRALRVRALEFEESLTRRQDDAHQEFLLLHNQAVAHAERITQDANEQVAASLEHAQRVSVKAEDFERLMRAQAAQIEAEAKLRARDHLDEARTKAQKIIDLVTAHSQSVLRDAEDRTRQLRWQQHQMTSFMAEVKELIRPEGPLTGAVAESGETVTDAGADEPEAVAGPVPEADAAGDDSDDLTSDVDAELADLVEREAEHAAADEVEAAEVDTAPEPEVESMDEAEDGSDAEDSGDASEDLESAQS